MPATTMFGDPADAPQSAIQAPKTTMFGDPAEANPTGPPMDQDKARPGFFGTLANDISSIPHAIANVGRLTGIGQTPANFSTAAHELADPNINLLKQGARETAGGQWLGGPVHMAEGLVPGVGPMAHQAANDFSAGNYGAGAARMLEIAGPKMLHDYAPPIASDAASGASRILSNPTPTGKALTSFIPVFGAKINALRDAMHANLIPDVSPLQGPAEAPVVPWQPNEPFKSPNMPAYPGPSGRYGDSSATVAPPPQPLTRFSSPQEFAEGLNAPQERPVTPWQPNKPLQSRNMPRYPGPADVEGHGTPPPNQATVGTRAEMMRQLRLRQQQNATAPLVRDER